MRNGQNKRMRGRNRNHKSHHSGGGGGGGGGGHHHNPLTRVYESNGPEVKIRGTRSSHRREVSAACPRRPRLRRSGHRRESLPARRALSAHDRRRAGAVPGAESLLSGAAGAGRDSRRSLRRRRRRRWRPAGARSAGAGPTRSRASRISAASRTSTIRRTTTTTSSRPIRRASSRSLTAASSRIPTIRAARSISRSRTSRTARRRSHISRRSRKRSPAASDVERLPSFITGSQPQQSAQNAAPNGYDNNQGGDRYPRHRRRRHRGGPGGPRPDLPNAPQDFRGDDGPERRATADAFRFETAKGQASPGPFVYCALPRRAAGRRRQHRLERRHQTALLALGRNRAIDLLGRLDDMHAGERRRDGGAGALPGHRRAQEPAALDRRHVQRLAPVHRREPGLAQQMRDLRARIGPAVTERRGVHARPQAAPVRHHREQLPAGRQHPPDFAQQRGRRPATFPAHAPAARDRPRRPAAAVRTRRPAPTAPASRVGHFTTPWAAGMKARQRSASSRNSPR